MYRYTPNSYAMDPALPCTSFLLSEAKNIAIQKFVMICHDPTWLCPGCTRLYINYLGKVFGKNALDFHFWNPDHVTDDVTAQLYTNIIYDQGEFFT